MEKFSKKDLVQLRLEKAQEDLIDARMALDAGRYNMSVNRSYYAMFHGVLAVNALDGFSSSKHSENIGYFNKVHVKDNPDFDKNTYKIIHKAMQARSKADYDDEYIIGTKTDAEENLENAEEFLSDVNAYLKGKGNK